jgi:hypothetical protein
LSLSPALFTIRQVRPLPISYMPQQDQTAA